MIVAVALSPCVDRTIVVDRLVVGAVHRPSLVTVTPGGKGFNVARAARTLGADVLAAGIVGGHSGRWLAAGLAEEGIDTVLIDGINETRTSVSVADLSTGVMTDLYEPATPVTTDEWDRLLDHVAGRLSAGDWLSVSGTHATGAPEDSVSRLVHLGHAAGAFVAVDTHGPALADAVSAAPEIVKINFDEARGLLGSVTPDRGPAALSAEIAAATGGLAVITAGPDGAYGAGLHVACPGVFGPYPVGSGDSFLAGLLAGLDGRADWQGHVADGLCLATAAATANALRPGAACFARGTAEALVGRTTVRPVETTASS